jgi:CheY-like chemotaxis protein/nitrogen-specific signal transduction histidine kinase/CHASE3 domain sensor protein/HPt (histidine-containing phosphotransfer) domain-containing protein
MHWVQRMRWLQRWLDLSLRTKCLLLISFPAAATVAMAAASYLVGTGTTDAGLQLKTSLRIGQAIERLRGSEIEMSAQARAYLITEDESFAGKTREAMAAFDSAWQDLSDLTADDRFERQRLAQVAALERSRVERTFEDTSRFRSHALPWDQLAGALTAAEAERLGMENILKSMQADNAASIGAYLVRASQLRARQNTILAIGLFLGVVGGLALTLLFAHSLTSRIETIQGNIAQLGAGAGIEAVPGRDEIGTLSECLVRIAGILQHRRTGLESAPHGIAEVDGLGRYRWLNKAYAESAGLTEAYRPQTVQATIQAEDRPKIQEAIRVMHLDGRAEVAAHMQPRSGPAAEVEMTFLETSGPPDAGFYVFLRDSGSGQADPALIRDKDAAVASNRAKSDFLAKISHDIRTPLNAILGAADLLSQTALSFDQSEYVHMFQRNCRRLLALINDFLDFSRIEAGAVHVDKAPFRIREIVNDTVATFRDAAAGKGILLEVDIDPLAPEWQMGDSLRIQQVLVNLLSNALKFTAAGRVDVRVKVLEAAGAGSDAAMGSAAGSGARSDVRRLRYEVLDTGPGIASENQDKIFMKFVQLPNQTAGPRGTGLGLAICRDLVELMGGEIGVASRAGGGSNFHFSLPLEVAPSGALADPGPSSAAQSAGKLPASSAPVRILVAEDTEDNRLLIEHYLRSELVELRFAFTGQEAFDAVRRGEKFDLILMDLDMPVLDGIGATKAIRAWEASHGCSTPIVALTADAMSEAVHASLDAGCAAHVAKPVERGTLLKTIQRYANTNSVRSTPASSITVAVSEEVLALVPQYLASKDKQIEEARESLISRDFKSIRRFGHNLKGTGRGYGFPAIEELGREIEKAAVNADVDRVAEQLDALHRLVSESGRAFAVPVA